MQVLMNTSRYLVHAYMTMSNNNVTFYIWFLFRSNYFFFLFFVNLFQNIIFLIIFSLLFIICYLFVYTFIDHFDFNNCYLVKQSFDKCKLQNVFYVSWFWWTRVSLWSDEVLLQCYDQFSWCSMLAIAWALSGCLTNWDYYTYLQIYLVPLLWNHFDLFL